MFPSLFIKPAPLLVFNLNFAMKGSFETNMRHKQETLRSVVLYLQGVHLFFTLIEAQSFCARRLEV